MTKENNIILLDSSKEILRARAVQYLSSFGEEFDLAANPLILCSTDKVNRDVNGVAALYFPAAETRNLLDVSQLHAESLGISQEGYEDG